MAGQTNFQTCRFQCIRPGELWQCNWLEGTYDSGGGRPEGRTTHLSQPLVDGSIYP